MLGAAFYTKFEIKTSNLCKKGLISPNVHYIGKLACIKKPCLHCREPISYWNQLYWCSFLV